jgi:AP-4 complex subunit epsilon-1
MVNILKQIVDHRLPRDYDYHRLPAPWIQIKLLQILGILGKDDKVTSEAMYDALRETMQVMLYSFFVNLFLERR